MKLEEYIKAIQQYNGFHLLRILIDENARMWVLDSRPEIQSPDFTYEYLLNAYAPRIASLIYSFGSAKSSREITYEEFKKLVTQYVNIDESFSEDEVEKVKIIKSIKEDPQYLHVKDLDKYLTPDLATSIFINILVGRNKNSQWSNERIIVSNAVARNLAVFKKFQTLISFEDNRLITNYLGMSPETYIQSIFTLQGVIYSEKFDNTLTGFITFDGKTLEKHFSSISIDLRVDDLRLLAEKLSAEYTSFYNHTLSEIQSGGEDAKYFQTLFAKFPLIKDQSEGTLQRYACPSPWMLRVKAVNFLSDYFVDLFQTKERAKQIRDAWGEATGHVFKEVVVSLKKQAHVIDIDHVELDNLKKSRFGDLILHEDGRVLIIELKTAIGNIYDKNYLTNQSVSKMLLMQLRALDQCHQTKINIEKYVSSENVQSIGYLVVTAQLGAPESDFVHSLDKATSYFTDKEYAPFDVINIQELEIVLSERSVSEIVDSLAFNRMKRIDNKYEDQVQIFEAESSCKIEKYEELIRTYLPQKSDSLE